MTTAPLRVLFLCTGNAARSQMAEALLRQLTGGRAEVWSAGTTPEPDVHPIARRTLEDTFQIDTSALYPKSLDRFRDDTFDFVITVCDKVAERCPVFPGDPEPIHWSFADPVPITDPDQQRRAFEHVANGLAARMRIWMSLPTFGADWRRDRHATGSLQRRPWQCGRARDGTGQHR